MTVAAPGTPLDLIRQRRRGRLHHGRGSHHRLRVAREHRRQHRQHQHRRHRARRRRQRDGQGPHAGRLHRRISVADFYGQRRHADRDLPGDRQQLLAHDRHGGLLRRDDLPGDRRPWLPLGVAVVTEPGTVVPRRVVRGGLRIGQPGDVGPGGRERHHHRRLFGRRQLHRRLLDDPGLGPGRPGHRRTRRSPPRPPLRARSLTATVVVTSPGNPPVVGTVAFYDGTTLLGTEPVVEWGRDLERPLAAIGDARLQRRILRRWRRRRRARRPLTISTASPTVTRVLRVWVPRSADVPAPDIQRRLDPATAEDSSELLARRADPTPGGPQLRGRHRFGGLRCGVEHGDPGTARRWNIHWQWRLTVNGTSPGGMKGASGCR